MYPLPTQPFIQKAGSDVPMGSQAKGEDDGVGDVTGDGVPAGLGGTDGVGNGDSIGEGRGVGGIKGSQSVPEQHHASLFGQ